MRSAARVLSVLFLGLSSAAVLGREPVVRVELASFRQLSADVASLGTHVQNPMMNMGLMMFGNVVGAPGLLGVDQERPIQLALFSDGGDWTKAERVLVLPVLNEGLDYLNGLGVSYETLQDDGVVRRLRANRNVQSFREMSVRVVGDRAIVSPSAPLVQRVAEMLEAQADALAPGGISGTVRASVDIDAVLPALRRQFEEQARAADAMGGGDGDPAEMMRLYAEGVLEVLDQARGLAFGLQCDSLGLTLYSRLDAKPETSLARMCGDFALPSERLLQLLPPEATAVYASGTLGSLMRHGSEPYMEFLGKLVDVQQRMMQAMAGGEVPAFDFKEFMTAQMDGMKDLYGDDYVVSVGAEGEGGSVAFFQAMAVKDGEKYLALMDESMKKVDEIYAEMKVPFRLERRGDRSFEEVPIRTFGITFVKPAPEEAEAAEADAGAQPQAGEPAAAAAQPVDAEAAAVAEVAGDAEEGLFAAADDDEDEDVFVQRLQEEMWEDMAEELAWLEEGVMEMAVADGVLLMALGQPGCLDPFIGRLHNPPAEAWRAKSRTLFPDVKNHDQAVEFCVVKPLALAKSLVPLFDKEGESARLLARLPEDGEGVGTLTMASPSAAMGALRVSAATLGAFARTVQLAQREAMRDFRGDNGPLEDEPLADPVEVILPEN